MASETAVSPLAADGAHSPTAADAGSYLLSVHVEELSVDKTLRVRGDLHIGGAMYKLVESLAIPADWSDHAFWWPERKLWLTKLRLTLDQYGVHADSRLLFTSMHKPLRVQLPDLQIIELKVNFSVNVFNAVLQLARELGIRHAEELSFIRRPEDRSGRSIAKSKTIGRDAQRWAGGSSGGRCISSSPSVTSSLPRDVGCSSGGTRLSAIMSRPLSPRVLATTSGTLRSGAVSATSSPQATLMKCPALLSPGSHLSWRPDGWPSGTLSPLGRSLSLLSAGKAAFGYDLIHSPGIQPVDALTMLGQPKTYTDRAWINSGWLNSSRSLMEQGVQDTDLIRLRFKYYDFYDLNPKYDSVRLNQLYEQARWQLISEEVTCNDDEMMMFAALQLQVRQQLEAGGDECDGLPQSPKHHLPSASANNDVDAALSSLQAQLQGSTTRNATDITQLPELHDYLRYFRPRRYTVRGAKRCWCVLRDNDVLLYNSKQAHASGQKHFHALKLGDFEVQSLVNVSQGRFVVRLMSRQPLPSHEDIGHGLPEEWLKCENPQQYARWITAARFGSEGRTMADPSYDSEVSNVESLLNLQQPVHTPIDTTDRGSVSKVTFDPADYVAPRFYKYHKSKICQKILDAHAKVRHMNLTEAKMNYIKAWRSLPAYGIVYFLVKFRNSKKEELLGIAWNRLIRLDCRKGEATKTYRYTTLKAWNIQWEIKEMTVEFDEETLAFRCLSADLKTVHEFIGGYIFLALRSREKSQILNEELFHRLTGGHVQ